LQKAGPGDREGLAAADQPVRRVDGSDGGRLPAPSAAPRRNALVALGDGAGAADVAFVVTAASSREPDEEAEAHRDGTNRSSFCHGPVTPVTRRTLDHVPRRAARSKRSISRPARFLTPAYLLCPKAATCALHHIREPAVQPLAMQRCRLPW